MAYNTIPSRPHSPEEIRKRDLLPSLIQHIQEAQAKQDKEGITSESVPTEMTLQDDLSELSHALDSRHRKANTGRCGDKSGASFVDIGR